MTIDARYGSAWYNLPDILQFSRIMIAGSACCERCAGTTTRWNHGLRNF
jgi:hypothetical protein